MSLRIRAEILAMGIVQGVGFRPFVYQLALRLNLKGYTRNSAQGAQIMLEGEKADIERFLEILRAEPPSLARIDSLEVKWSEFRDEYASFEIIKSSDVGKFWAMLPADISLCPECLKELKERKNRRYAYPFINCTQCGPRYTIVRELPYDRPHTSMAGFEMCPKCKSEYENPHSRRFHAEPISCPQCGPQLSLHRADGTILAQGNRALDAVAKLLKKGHIIAIKGIGGFHLVCDATKSRVVMELRARKNRPSKPFAVMFRSIFDIAKCTELTPLEEELLRSPERPIVLISKRRPHRLEKFAISCDGVAPNIDTMGVFLPYSPLHVLLMEQVKIPLVFTSANVSGEPLVRDSSELCEKLEGVFDYYLDHDREIINLCDDSVVTIADNHMQIIRCARGYAPVSRTLPYECAGAILALGAQQKSSLALAFSNRIILSPYIGDLANLASIEYYHRIREMFSSLYHFTPTLLVADKHPQYESTRFALQQREIPVVLVQHHYAHMLSLLAEHEIREEILGIIWDGTGYGDDGSIWGGEFLRGDMRGYTRVGHFKPFRLLGGESAIKEPRRLALALLLDLYGDEIESCRHPIVASFEREELEILRKMHARGLHSPLCSSVGRLFDAIAALAGIIEQNSFEGESGMVMEGLYDSNITEFYPYSIREGIVDTSELVRLIASGADSRETIASKFINTLAHIALDMAQRYAGDSVAVGFSGGVFQNRELCNKISELFKEAEISYYMHEKIPCNDGGIAFGQIAFTRFLERT